jgi:hypothetical protein
VPSSVLLETDLGPYAPAVQWLETRLWIKDKRGRRRPLILNTPQRRYLRAKAAAIAAGKKPHFLVLKSRRTGITTLEQALSFELTSLHPHQNAITLAHDIESTKKIFEISRFFHRNLTGGDDAKGSAREFRFFGGDSLFWIGTAGTKSFGRGQTLQRVHWSESAHTPGQLDEIENLLVGLTEACSHGEMVLETTANGASGLFYRMWCEASQGESNFTPIFIPWWWDEGNVVRLPDAGLAEIEASLTVVERQARLVLLFQQFERTLEYRRREQRVTIPIPAERPRLPQHRLDDVSVVDIGLLLSVDSLHHELQRLRVVDLEPIVEHPNANALALQPRWHRVRRALHPDRPTRSDAHVDLAELRKPSHFEWSHHRELFGKALRPRPIALLEHRDQPRNVVRLRGEVAAAA